MLVTTKARVLGSRSSSLGRASADLGAGRKRKGDPIDPAVGIVLHPKIGDRLERGQELGAIHARSRDDAAGCSRRIASALSIAEETVEAPPLVYAWYGG